MWEVQIIKPLILWIWMSGFAAGTSAAGAEPAKAEAEPALTGKVLAITMKRPEGSGCFVADIETRKLGGTTFIVGRLEDNGQGNSVGIGSTLWIATDNIAQMVEFKSLEDARRIYRASITPPPPPAAFPIPMPAPGVETARYTEASGGTLPLTSTTPGSPGSETTISSERTFKIPLQILDPDRIAAKGIWCYLSKDRGKTWTKHCEASAGDACVNFTAPTEGEYWFALQIVAKDGKADPPDTSGLIASSKIVVTKPSEAPSPRMSGNSGSGR